LKSRVPDLDPRESWPELVMALSREADALQECRGAGIPNFIDWIWLHGDPCIRMERVAGSSLADTLDREGPLPWEVVLPIASELLTCLDRIHRRGWVHCDINPGNVICNRTVVSLVDFGAAQRIGAPSQWIWPLGRHRYMAPEHLNGRWEAPRYSRLSTMSDQHQVACLIVHLLTGEQPFRPPLEEEDYGTTFLAALGAWMSQPADVKMRTLGVETRRNDVPAGLDDILARALDPEPDRRYTSAAQMRMAFLSLV
jgi:serine/threonine protein kinase